MKKTICLFLSVCLLAFDFVCVASVSVWQSSTSRSAANVAEKTYALDIVPYGGVIQNYVTDRVYYSRREDNTYYRNPYRLPFYCALDMLNACAITAGGAVIGHFDRLYEELIPDHTGFVFMGQWVYGSQGDAVNAMHRELYSRMETDADGTSVVGYTKGLASYATSKGRTATITKAYANSALNKSEYMSALESGKLLTVFVDGFSIVNDSGVGVKDGYDEIKHCIVTGAHTATAYGYRNIRYYDSSDNLIKEDCYLFVHSGFTSVGFAMIHVNQYTTVDDGYIINIT